MSKKYNPANCNLDFVKGSLYKDLRNIGGNAYRDIKMSLTLGTSSDLVYYLKEHSKLFKNLDGDEIVEPITKGMFSEVYLIKDRNGSELVVKRSHDGMLPLQIGRSFYFPVPRFVVDIFFQDYDIGPNSLKRDVYEYSELIQPFLGTGRAKLESKKFQPYLNMALHMVDKFLPQFTLKDIYSQDFWNELLTQEPHKKLSKLKSNFKSITTPRRLIPLEERYILYDSFSDSLQTIFVQDAMRGEKEIIPGKKMAYPFELISHGFIPKEMPKLMVEHLLRKCEMFVHQLREKAEIPRVPDMRPLDSWKVFPPTPYEIYIAETSNLVAYLDKQGKLKISYVDTHVLHEPEGALTYRWVERRCWISTFLNLRFWVRKALESST